MELLKQRILAEGRVLPGDILKVDSFLNHQIDTALMNEIGSEFHRLFADEEITKILTIEASGIAIATMLGHLYDVPVVFAKKSETANSTDNKYVSQAYSFTHKQMNSVFVSKPYLNPSERVLIVDDFLADGQAVHALIDIVHQAGGKVAGIGIAVEKGQQKGGRMLREEGYRLESIAIIEEMDWETQTIRFRE
jgi:xanthine phosphoribosyltransferase